MATKRSADDMSKSDDQDPDYEMVTTMTSSKRMRLLEQDAKDATVKRIEAIIRKQFDIEMRHKEKEVILIDERIHQARAILDKLRACIVASYYGNVSSHPAATRGEQSKRSKLDLNHPAIQRVIKQAHPPLPPSSNASQATSISEITPGIGDAALAALVEETMDEGSRPETPQTPMLNGEISELLSSCSTPDSEKLSLSDELPALPGIKGPRNTGENTFGVGPPLPTPKPIIPQASEEDGSRFHVKKRIIVGNVSKYISPENREDSDPSTHKWMVYVRGPHNEPRIDHFVKKIWFFLHPSYRPNDLVEVKEPPFHLTRRGWGEFPIRVQLHFVDPRNKKVDIIHHLKLDRTYTGLQTLGAETIVDVELDRYLFDEAGQPVSRPSTPTVTSVKYKEGCKPEPTSPGANVTMPTTPSIQVLEIMTKPPLTLIEQSPAPSPSLQESRKGTPTPELLPPPTSKIPPVLPPSGNTTLGTMSIKEQGGAITGVIGAGGIKTQLVKSLPTVGPQLAIQQQQGGRFVRVMPPLGPITSQAKSGVISLSSSTTIAKTPPSVVTQPSDAGATLSNIVVTESDSSIITPDLSNPLAGAISPTATAVNVAEAAASTSPPGKGALAVRIQEGKLVADVSPTAQLTPATCTTATPSVSSAPVLQTMTQLVSPVSQAVTNLASSTVVQIASGVKPLVTQPKAGPAAGIKVIPTRTTPLSSPTHGQASSLPVIPNPPPGTQYYITAKSTDPNLQGKVILIPQQVFAQASGQSVLVGSKGGRPGPSQIQGKGGAALKPTPASKSSFLSPSNVLILPQGSIVPPLPPGSIVQIQQVPSPSRSPQQQSQPKPRLAVPQKSASAPALVPTRSQAPRVAGVPSGGIIQIQRTAGQSTAKVLSSQLGASPVPSTSGGISLLPEKGTLAKTPSGGVVFVQRSPSTGKLNAQPVTGISVAGQPGIPQKVALAAQLTSCGTLKPGSTVSIIQGPGKATGQTVVLQSPTGLPKLQQMKTIQRPTQPIILGQTGTLPASTIGQAPTQALISSQGKVQLVSVVPSEKNPGKQPETTDSTEASKIPGQTPMPLSHEVTIETSESTPPPEAAETQRPVDEVVKTEPMDVVSSVSNKNDAEKEASVALMNLAASEHISGLTKQTIVPPVPQNMPAIGSLLTAVVKSQGSLPTGVSTSTGSLPPAVITSTGSLPPAVISTTGSLPPAVVASTGSLQKTVVTGTLPSAVITSTGYFPTAVVTSTGSLPTAVVTSTGSLPKAVVTGTLPSAVITSMGSLPTAIVTSKGSLQTAVVTSVGSLPTAVLTSTGSFPSTVATSSGSLQKVVVTGSLPTSIVTSMGSFPTAVATSASSLPTAVLTSAGSLPTAVVTSHGLVQVQTATDLVSRTQQLKTTGPIATTSTTSVPIVVSTTPPTQMIQIKQEVLSPVKTVCSAPVVLGQLGTSFTSSMAPRAFVVPSAPTTLLSAPGASTTILAPNISGTLLRPVTSSATVSRLLATTPSATILKPNTSVLSATLPGTLLGPSSIGQQTIIVTSAVPTQVIGSQQEKVKVQQAEDPLLVELRRRSREGPVSVYALETMEDLIKAVVEKIPLINEKRVQSEHPFMATSLEHFCCWNVGKRRAAEWQRALAVKQMAKEAAKRCKKLKDVGGWSTKKIMWWCRRHGYTPQDDGSHKSRQWCNVCGEVEMKWDDDGEMKPHDCTNKWMSSTGLLQNTSYTTSDEFVKSIEEKQQELGEDDNDSDMEIDVINISKKTRPVKIKKEETDNRIKCFLPPSDGARLVTDVAHEIGVQFKPVEIADGTYANVAQEMLFTAGKQFLGDLLRGAFANAYGDRKEHRYPTEILPTHVFEAIAEKPTWDFMTNHHLGIPMPDNEEKDEEDST